MGETNWQAGPKLGEPAGQGALADHKKRAVLAELDKTLSGHAFRTSKRSQQFLRYVVEQALDGQTESLKERTIGVAVFERQPDYDTGEDATVRVAANEVRKRLAQWHLESSHSPVRIELPPGGYSPEFHFAEEPLESLRASEEAQTQGKQWSRWRWWFGVTTLVVAGLVIWTWWSFHRTPFESFWEPALRSGRPVIICLANPVVYHLSDGFNQEYAKRKNFDLLAGQSITDVRPEALGSGDLVVSADQYVGSGDAYAVGSLTAMLARLGATAQIRIGNDLSFADLRSSPAILIGAYSNRWTMKANTEYRFAFDRFSVVDRKDRSRQWRLGQVSPDFKAQEDYAIVSRVMKSYSGEPVVMAAGITNMGTQAAAEFVSKPEYLNEALRAAPPGWREKNLQMVLHCRVIGSTPGPPRVVALHVW